MSDKNRIPPPPPPDNKTHKDVVVEYKTFYKDGNMTVAPPNAEDLEVVVLASLLVDKRGYPEVGGILSPEVFYQYKHKLIYRAIQTLGDKGDPIDIITVSNELKKAGKLQFVGGDFYLIQISNRASSSAHIEFHSRIILQYYVQRELIKMSQSIMSSCLKDDPEVFGAMDDIEVKMANIRSVAVKNGHNLNALSPADEIREKVKNKREGNMIGFPLGISDFDEWSGGIMLRELITIAARPGMGKTAVMISIARFLAFDCDLQVTVFTLEMSRTDIINRIAAGLTNISYNKIRKGDLNDEELEKLVQAIDFIEKSKLEITDSSECKNNLDLIVSKIRRRHQEGSRISIVDYVQITKVSNPKNPREDISQVTGKFKELTNELNSIIIQLAQLGREVDKRPGHRPKLSDLKESGSIEQDSDMVIFPVREAYYKEDGGNIQLPPKVAGDTNFIVAKGRSTGTRDFHAYLDFSKYRLESYSDAIF